MHEIDGSYFESFTALAWKQENQRQTSIKTAESTATEPPPQESEVGITPIDYSMPQNEKDKLYVEMLYTIANTVSFINLNLNCARRRMRMRSSYQLEELFCKLMVKH